MKQFFGLTISWALYGAGHIVSIPMGRFDWAFLYRPYNWLMIKSCEVQDRSGCSGPWENVEQ